MGKKYQFHESYRFGEEKFWEKYAIIFWFAGFASIAGVFTAMIYENKKEEDMYWRAEAEKQKNMQKVVPSYRYQHQK